MDSFSNVTLSMGSLAKILDGIEVETATLQILGYKRVPGGGVERYRLLLNDGSMLFSFAILATNLNSLITNRKLEKFSIIKLNKYHCSEAQPNKKIIVCLEITPLIPGNQINRQIEYANNSEESNSDENKDSPKLLLNNESCPAVKIEGNNQCIPNSAACFNSPSTSKTNSFIKADSSVNSLESNKISNCSAIKVEDENHSDEDSSDQEQNDRKPLLVPDREHVGTRRNTRQYVVLPIESLTPYMERWTIKARVIHKSHIIHKSDKIKPYKSLFSFLLLDESGEIRATAFDWQAENLYDNLILNKVYFISNAKVKDSYYGGSHFELSFTLNTEIEEFYGDTSNFPAMEWDFTPIRQINNPNKPLVDVLGVCYNASAFMSFTSKVSNQEISKLDIKLIDTDESKISVTLWGSDAVNFISNNYPVVAIKNAKVTEYKGYSLNVSRSSLVFINPDLEEAYLLKSWFAEYQKNKSLNQDYNFDRDQLWKNLWEINSLELKEPAAADYSTVKATVIMVQKENAMYRACPSPDCYKKVFITPNDKYHCSKCNQEYDCFNWTILLNLNMADFTSDLWAVAFRETAESILEITSDALGKVKNESEDKYLDALSNAQFKSFVFKLRSRMETFNETTKLKTTIIDCNPVEPLSYTRKILGEMKQMEKLLYNLNDN